MARFLIILFFSGMAGLFYVYTEVEAVKVGYFIRQQEEAKAQSLDRARALKYNIAALKAPQNLERKLTAQKIQLESPRSWQTLVLPGKGTAKPAPAIQRPPFFRFFLGTAQAEAKETDVRS